MGLSMNERKAVTREVVHRYQKARQFCKADLLANTKGVCQDKRQSRLLANAESVCQEKKKKVWLLFKNVTQPVNLPVRKK